MELFGLWRLKIGEVNIEILSRSFHGAREIVRDTEVVEYEKVELESLY